MAANVAILADPDCAGRQVMDLLANKWTIRILVLLVTDGQRYNQLYRLLPGVSHKMLSQTLKALEQKGLVDRQVYASIPPQVTYALTDLGQSLYGQLLLVAEWAEEHSVALGCAPRTES